MNSSGIKRGLAATAISALAISGIPALATTASAAVGDSFTVTSTGPALNGGAEGAVVTIRAKDGQITPNLIKAVGTSGDTIGSEDNGDQTVEVVGASGPRNDASDSTFEFIDVRVAVTTTTTGGTATFRLFEDDAPDNNKLDASEARQSVSISTAGPLASIDIAPTSQSTPQGIESGAYTVTIKDSAGRTTQLAPGTSITVDDDTVEASGVAADDVIASDEIAKGVASFTANPNGAAVGTYNIKLTQGAVTKTATLAVTKAATLAAGDIDIVTAADSWDGPGGGANAGVTRVRVDQNTIRFDFDAADSQAGANVQLKVDGAGVTFGGKDKDTYTTTLDANGNGSITVVVDAATIQDVDSFDVDINGFTQTLKFERAAADFVTGESDTYFCQLAAPCTVTAVVTDQFGNPVTSGEVEARRTGSNTDATPQRKQVGSDGTVDFTFTDTKAVNNGTDSVEFEYFLDQFDTTPEFSGSTTIKYTTTGQGNDYVILLDGENTEAPAYKPSDAAVIPLTDTVANTTTGGNDEDAEITLTGGENGQAVTLSVDNGALILAPTKSNLSDGVASVNTTLTGAGALAAGYRVIGTKSGPVTLTVVSAGRTETAQLVVSAQDDSRAARNVTVSGPAEVPNGTTQIAYTAVVTDAFGNPVQGVTIGQLNIQVTGPAMFQDGGAVTDANGMINLNVRVDSGAEGAVTIRVQGLPAGTQFGAAADRQGAASATDDGKGLAKSSDVASATTTVKADDEVVIPDPPRDIIAKLKGKNNGGKNDRLKVVINAEDRIAAAGAKVKLIRVDVKKLGSGKKSKKVIQTKTLGADGRVEFVAKDLNGRANTKYFARVMATAKSNMARANNRNIR